MNIQTWDEFIIKPSSVPLAVTIGVFDGLHAGHQALITEVLNQEPSMMSGVITFVESPKKVLHPASFKGSIFSLEQKMETLASSGIQLCVLIDFSQDFGKHSGVDFLRLLYKAGVRFLCVGPNFKCGHNMDTNATELMELCVRLGIRSKIVDPVLYKGYPISSSRVRKAISEGDFAEAEKMLGRPYEIRLHAVEDEAGACLYSSKDRDLVLPPDGEYRIGIREGAGFRMVEARISMGRLCWPPAVGNPALRVAIFGRVSKEA